MTVYTETGSKHGMDSEGQKLGIEDLPLETQKDIVKHVREDPRPIERD